MDYLYYVLVVLVIGLISFGVVRIATRSKNPDLLMQYEARKKSLKQAVEQSKKNPDSIHAGLARTSANKSGQDRYVEKTHYRTPWGWPGAERQNNSPGVSESVRNFADRLVSKKQVLQSGSSSPDSIRALLEDRYGAVNKDMTEVPYQKVKRPLLRDPSEQHDQLDNLGRAESRKLRKKLQFLSAISNQDLEKENASGEKRANKVEFRYVELKDLKQPWGW